MNSPDVVKLFNLNICLLAFYTVHARLTVPGFQETFWQFVISPIPASQGKSFGVL